MKTQLQEDIAKMRSLMSRMDTPMTNRQAMLNEEMMMEGKPVQRTEYNDMLEMLWDKKFHGAWWVGLGYVINAGVPKTVYPNQYNADRISQFAKDNPDQEWSKKLSGIMDDPKWGKIMSGKSKSAGFRAGIGNIIAVVKYNIQWQNGASFGKFYGKRMAGEHELMRKWGVDPMEVQQNKEANKERQNNTIFYTGQVKNGAQPIFGGRIGDFKNGEIARYSDRTEKMALKHASANVYKGDTQYFYQNEDGQYVSIGKDLVSFLTYELGGKESNAEKEARKIQQQVEQEAATFESELKKYRNDTNSMIKTFLLRQIGYIVATVKDQNTGIKEPIAYVNKNVNPSEGSKGFEVNAETLYPILKKLANFAEAEVEQAAESSADEAPVEEGE